MPGSKDLFDNTVMSFGEHLEVLRVHLWKSIIGLVICVIICLLMGDQIVAVVRKPIDDALSKYSTVNLEDDVGDFEGVWNYLKSVWSDDKPKEEDVPVEELANDTIIVEIQVAELAKALHKVYPEQFPIPKAAPNDTKDAQETTSSAASTKNDKSQDNKGEEKTAQSDAADGGPKIQVAISSPAFKSFKKTAEDLRKPVTLNVQEAFLMYLKVAVIAGLVLSSPWIFFQIWQFVAAGLYSHEQKYVYKYLPLSLGLFLTGTVFCFLVVFPFILKFLLSFNAWLDVNPQIRLSEWVSFAVTLPLMFGLSFQLPLVMLFLERISIFNATDYREKRRMAVLVIAILSMLLTPADPMSMILMMIPLVLLYEFGIILCAWTKSTKSPFEAEPV